MGWQDVCTKFHRVNKKSELECIKSDKYISDHLHEANPAVSYKCPHGMVDNAIPIIIEGIHALNDKLTATIPKRQVFKIYISPQLQMNLDDHNPISITNLRLLRRIVRDKKFRNAPAIRTINMWESVRRGEFRWIYPNQENADYVYNSGLQYELCVMKKYALPTLQEIPYESEHYVTANRLIKFLKYFVDIDDSYVPCNSLLREFIGGSCFVE